MKLTAANVKTLTVPTGKTEITHYDDDVKGFGVRCKASGARSYVMSWKVKALGGKFDHRRVTIGAVSDIEFGKAKNRAKDLKADIRKGADPATEIQTAKLDAAHTYEATAAQFLDTLQTRDTPYRPRAFKEIKRHLTKNAAPLNKKQVGKITRDDITTVFDAVTKNNGAVTANRMLTSLSVFFAWALPRYRLPANPCIGIEKNEEKTRDRALTPAELRLVWNATGDDDYGSIIKLLALTGQRESEIGGLRRSEIHEALIILPPERTKNKRAHIVPLSSAALAIIDAQEKREDRDLIFGRGEGGFSGWSKSKERLDERIKKANGGKAIEHWTLHDLRRTFRTYASGGLARDKFEKLSARDKELARGLRIREHVLGAVQNHVSVYKTGITAVYDLSDYDQEKREALDAWAARLELIISDADNVTPLRRAKA
jgi:integrase